MERTITIDGKEVRLRASAAIPRLYRLKFKRDILVDMKLIQEALLKSGYDGSEETAASSLPIDVLTLFENAAYLMARHADPESVPDSVDDWLDGFETFSIYKVFPVIRELWSANLVTLSKPKKKQRRRTGR